MYNALEHKMPDVTKINFQHSRTVTPVRDKIRRCVRHTKPKTAITRLRPYVRYQEPTLIPADEETLCENGSYPSGHSIRGWATALLLCEINPAARAEYARLAGQSTSVEAARAANPTPSAAIYNLAGEQVGVEPHTGVYIQSGKKYVK